MNIFRTGLLMAAMTGLFLVIGYLLGGEVGMALAFAIALGMNIFAYWNSDKVVLSMYRAREVDEHHKRRIWCIWCNACPGTQGFRCRASTSWIRRNPTLLPLGAILGTRRCARPRA